ncbi:hypothetical protein [Candidatus Palauibacter sp.]|uniref:hypothetical protein n=1 Tax=Candidatus Palauibacter sp. TaxID=3101350 RepID=UPI003B5CFE40
MSDSTVNKPIGVVSSHDQIIAHEVRKLDTGHIMILLFLDWPGEDNRVLEISLNAEMGNALHESLGACMTEDRSESDAEK